MQRSVQQEDVKEGRGVKRLFMSSFRADSRERRCGGGRGGLAGGDWEKIWQVPMFLAVCGLRKRAIRAS